MTKEDREKRIEKPEMMICKNWKECSDDRCGIHCKEHKKNDKCNTICEHNNISYKCIPYKPETDWQKELNDWRNDIDMHAENNIMSETNIWIEKGYESVIEKMAKEIEKKDNVYKDLIQINTGNMNAAIDRSRIINELKNIIKKLQQKLKEKREIPEEIIDWLKYNSIHAKVVEQTCNKCCLMAKQLLKIREEYK
ncbi:MAG TPA: hypothetical protein VGB37_12060 [Candidatus Lokiarchaeia archaeon]